ncbi:unnamed protein product [Clonostachys rhizophaga]|uniref:Uncharacterized protein n=1 Tax=Clonostachys rhizophaga TaxID=160324 RepID=A0A9N9YX28_9HYPO|nr:unnamed protein product [Clonostachys rhizophaga]
MYQPYVEDLASSPDDEEEVERRPGSPSGSSDQDEDEILQRRSVAAEESDGRNSPVIRHYEPKELKDPVWKATDPLERAHPTIGQSHDVKRTPVYRSGDEAKERAVPSTDRDRFDSGLGTLHRGARKMILMNMKVYRLAARFHRPQDSTMNPDIGRIRPPRPLWIHVFAGDQLELTVDTSLVQDLGLDPGIVFEKEMLVGQDIVADQEATYQCICLQRKKKTLVIILSSTGHD